jgi:hypothetical protein
MRNYNTGVSGKVIASILAAVVLTAGVVAIAIYFPGGTDPTPPPPVGLGAQTAAYLNSMRDNVQFYWMCNSTFVNEDLTDFYIQTEPSAFVDGVKMNRSSTGGDIEVLFSPYDADIIGTGQISDTEWSSLSGALVDDGIGLMDTPEDPPAEDFPTTWPVDFYFSVFFDDGTYFFAGFTSGDGLLYIHNGTWGGEFSDWGWPISTGQSDGYWLLEGGHLTAGINALYSAITNNVAYPE